MQEIARLATTIRDFHQRPENTAYSRSKARPDWNSLTSSLDVIGDTEMAFDAYLKHLDDPATEGELYISKMVEPRARAFIERPLTSAPAKATGA